MTQTQERPAVAGPGAKNINSPNDYTASAADLHRQFVDALTAAGIPPSRPGNIVADGRLHRFHVDGDKRGSRNGWAVLYLDGVPAGAYGSWKAAVSGQWSARDRHAMTRAERAEYRRRMDAARAERLLEQSRRHAEASARAASIWRNARPADRHHSYLLRKMIRPYTARQHGESLVLPVIDLRNQLHSLQFIEPDGSKKLLFGGAKTGHFTPVHGEMPRASRILIAEGFATGATLAEIDPQALVLAAIDAGNLKPVAVAVRKQWPGADLIVCGDADDVGRAKANAAAAAANALVAFPSFPPGVAGSDFNDLKVAMIGRINAHG